ncbi:MAG: MBL fold metallo-hydrolase [Oscillospiraceae bacterium]
MAFLYTLCSSSKGNCSYVGDKKSGILIDAGVGIRAFTKDLQLNGINDNAVKAIFVTHEHCDHTKGLLSISRKFSIPIYGSKKTLDALIKKNVVPDNATLFEINKKCVEIENLQVSAFKTPHDSVHSLGYKIKTENDKSLCFCTDLGCITDEVYQNLKSSDVVLLESNYDDMMLKYSDYPTVLKQRIKGVYGHLSNEMCSKTLTRLLNDGTKNFVLGHLSQNNNKPELAMKSALDELSKSNAVLSKDYILTIAPAFTVGNSIEI